MREISRPVGNRSSWSNFTHYSLSKMIDKLSKTKKNDQSLFTYSLEALGL